AHPVAQVLRWNQIGALLLHHGDAGVVNVRAVLNGVHASLGSPSDALRSVGVRGNFPAKTMRIGYDRLHLFQRVLRGALPLPLAEHAACGADLDHIGAILDDRSEEHTSEL